MQVKAYDEVKRQLKRSLEETQERITIAEKSAQEAKQQAKVLEQKLKETNTQKFWQRIQEAEQTEKTSTSELMPLSSSW